METKERPILFNREAVRAILAGRQTQTRRIIRRQPPEGVRHISVSGCVRFWKARPARGDFPYAHELRPLYDDEICCPYAVGDHLYVRETFGYVWPEWCDNGLIEENGSARPITAEECDVVYRVTDPDYIWANDEGEECTLWKPSIHMPKRLARIWLEVTGIRIERVQDISPQDVIYEAVPLGAIWGQPGVSYSDLSDPVVLARFPVLLEISMAVYWDNMCAKRDYGWDANPWVWVVEFSVL